MTWSGFILMAASVGTVTVLFAWCIYQVLTTSQESGEARSVEPHKPNQGAPP